MEEEKKPNTNEEVAGSSKAPFTNLEENKKIVNDQPKTEPDANDAAYVYQKPVHGVIDAVDKDKDKNSIRSSQTLNIIGLCVNIVLAFFTYRLYNQSVAATNIAANALTETVKANAISNQAINEAKRANEISEKSFESNDVSSRNSMGIAKKSLADQERQFEMVNKPILSIVNIVASDIEKDFYFGINNSGRLPARIVSVSNKLIAGDSLNKVNYTGLVDTKMTLAIVGGGNAQNFKGNAGDVLSNYLIKEIKAGRLNLFFIGQCKYVNTAKAGTRIYRFAYMFKYFPSHEIIFIEESDFPIK